MLLRHALDDEQTPDAIEAAVEIAYAEGYRTAEIAVAGKSAVTTKQFNKRRKIGGFVMRREETSGFCYGVANGRHPFRSGGHKDDYEQKDRLMFYWCSSRRISTSSCWDDASL